MKQTAVRLTDEMYDRLQAVAQKTGRTATYYIREAIEAHLEDMEDLAAAEEVMRRRQLGESRTYTLEEMSAELGLDD